MSCMQCISSFTWVRTGAVKLQVDARARCQPQTNPNPYQLRQRARWTFSAKGAKASSYKAPLNRSLQPPNISFISHSKHQLMMIKNSS